MVQPFSRSDPTFFEHGIDWVAGASKPGISIQIDRVSQVGPSPLTVTFNSDGPLKPMADDQYLVFVGGQTVARATVDETSITLNGFDIIGGADGEVLHIMVVGRLQNQSV